MALSKSTITGRVPLPSDENLQFAELTFALSGLDTEGADVLPGGISKRVVLIDSDIPAGFELWQNTAGLHGTHYRVLARWTVKDRDGVRDQYADLGIVQVGSDPSYTLADLINNGVLPAIGTFWSAITQAQYDAVIQAAADAQASAATATGAAADAAASAIEAALSAIRQYADWAEFYADVRPAEVGAVFSIPSLGQSYIARASGATSFNITRGDGAKFETVRPDGVTPIRAFGPVGSGDFGQDVTLLAQKLIDDTARNAANAAGLAHFPRGQYHRTASLLIPDFSRITGDGADATIFQSLAGTPDVFPVLVNKDPTQFNYISLESFGVWGGTHGLYIDAPLGSGGLNFRDINFVRQSISGITFEQFFQVALLTNVNFYDCVKGIVVRSPTSNAVTIIGGSFTYLSDTNIDLDGVESLTCIGTRFENGGVAGKYTLDLKDVRNVSFHNCYFENTHEYLLRSRRVMTALKDDSGPINFTACHFTFAAGGAAYKWDVDGAISFTDCDSYMPMRVPSQSILNGHNRGILKATRSGKLTSAQREISASFDVVTFSSDDTSMITSNTGMLTGRLSLSMVFLNSDGIGYTTRAQEYHIAAYQLIGAVNNLAANISLISEITNAGPAVLTLGVKAGASASALTVEAVLSGMPPDTDGSRATVVGWTFEWDQVSGEAENLLIVSVDT